MNYSLDLVILKNRFNLFWTVAQRLSKLIVYEKVLVFTELFPPLKVYD